MRFAMCLVFTDTSLARRDREQIPVSILARVCSSVAEHRSDKARVDGSIPSTPTTSPLNFLVHSDKSEYHNRSLWLLFATHAHMRRSKTETNHKTRLLAGFVVMSNLSSSDSIRL